MITNIWLKSQPKKKISYPDCYPSIFVLKDIKKVFITKINDKNETISTEADYLLESVSRVEFRPA